MKAQIRILATPETKERNLTFTPKNIFAVIRLYYRAKKMKADQFNLFFK